MLDWHSCQICYPLEIRLLCKLSHAKSVLPAIIWLYILKVVIILAYEKVSSHSMTKPTNDLCTQLRLRSAWASTWSEQSSLCALWVAKDPIFLHTDSKDSDQTGRMPRLIWGGSESSLGAQVILLVLSCCGSFCCCSYFSKVWHRSSNFHPSVHLSTIHVHPSIKSVSLQLW